MPRSSTSPARAIACATGTARSLPRPTARSVATVHAATKPTPRKILARREEKVFEGMAEQKNSSQKQSTARSTLASGVAGTILPSDLAIPCWVAPLQSPTPFRQAKYSVARKLNLGTNLPSASEIQNRHKRLPGPAFENRHKRLPGRRRETSELPARQIGILGIIVIHTHPQSTHCRF